MVVRAKLAVAYASARQARSLWPSSTVRARDPANLGNMDSRMHIPSAHTFGARSKADNNRKCPSAVYMVNIIISLHHQTMDIPYSRPTLMAASAQSMNPALVSRMFVLNSDEVG